jgi:NAD(P)-dependent dehydrogenase (short-subunit alcohol dehydrogenase family)
LIHNAGVAFDHNHVKSIDNIDMTMAVNFYAQFLLTHLLIDLLKNSAPARIVSVASGSHIFSSSKINYNPTSRWRYPGYTYMQSKVAIVYFTQELARRLSGSGVTINCLCPGLIYTGIHQNLCCPLRLLLRSCRTCMPTPADGAKTSIFLASSNVVDRVSGNNFVKCNIKGVQQRFKNKDKHVELWEASRKIVKLTELDPLI